MSAIDDLILDRDFNEIDRDLLGLSGNPFPEAFIPPRDDIAPAQGSPFLDKLLSSASLLKKSTVLLYKNW